MPVRTPSPEELAREAAADEADIGEPPKKRQRQPRPSPQQTTSAVAKAKAKSKAKAKGRPKKNADALEPTAADAAHTVSEEDAEPAAAASEAPMSPKDAGKGHIKWKEPITIDVQSASPASTVAAELSEPHRPVLRRTNAFVDEEPAVEMAPTGDAESTEGPPTVSDVAEALGMADSPPPSMDRAASSRDVFWSRDPRDSAIMLPPPNQTVAPYCHLCKAEVDPLSKGTRLLTKGAPHFRCGTCQCKCSTLSTMFGGWPIDHYRELSPIEQTNFWKQSTTGKENLKQMVEKLVIYKQIKQRWEQSAGDYLPLGVYAARGYTNLKEIERNCPKEWCNKLGEWTYKLMVRGSGEKNLEELAREEIHKLLFKKTGDDKKLPAEKKKQATAASGTTPQEEPSEKDEPAEPPNVKADDDGEGATPEAGDDPPTTQDSAATTEATGDSSSSSDDSSKKKKRRRTRNHLKRRLRS